MQIQKISLDDAQTVVSILELYIKAIKGTVAPSRERTKSIIRIEELHLQLLRMQDGGALMLMDTDVKIIDTGFTLFISQLEKSVPQSKNRDDTITYCQALQKFFKESFPPAQT